MTDQCLVTAACEPYWCRFTARMRRGIWIPLLVVFFVFSDAELTCGQTPQRVKIVQRLWGFDGRVVSGQFMPLSIEIDNLTDEDIEAQATLRSVTGILRETGGTATQSVFLGAHSRRWVYFYPYITSQSNSWQFSLKSETETIFSDPIDQPAYVLESDGSRTERDNQTLIGVLLDKADVMNRIPGTIKHMPEDIFPPYSTATHSLHAMFLDHVPDWETPRQEAMLSWLKCGGSLHLMKDQNNQMLRFSGLLAPLNDPFDEFHVGSGIVTRHDFQRAQLTKDVVARAVSPQGLSQTETEELAKFEQQIGIYANGQSLADDSELFSELRQLTQPEHMWVLIFLMSLCYVALIFPGCWILSKQRTLHFLVTYGAIAGLAGIFSLLFLFIGRRGYGEETSMHSVAIARAEDDTHSSVFQMTTLFVTAGNIYSVSDKDHQTLFASGTSDEGDDARFTSGNSADYVSRIPPYSSQSIRSRRRIETDNWEIAVTNLVQQGDELKELKIVFGDKFPNDPLVKCMVMHGQNIYQTTTDYSKRSINLSTGRETIYSYGVTHPTFVMGNPILLSADEQQETIGDPEELCFKRILPQLVRRSLVDDCVQDIRKFRLAEDRVRLFVYAPMQPSQHLSVSGEVQRAGRILYVRDLLLNPQEQNVDVVVPVESPE